MKDRLATLLYWLSIRTWVSLVMLFAARPDVKGRENIPPHGSLILVSNHLNNGDPPALTHAMPRRVVWMAKQELFDTPGVGLLFRAFGLIPVRRFEADLGALRKAQAALRRGQVLGMFPEGTRSPNAQLGDAEPGTALIALRSGAPVLPAAIWGTEHVKLPRDIFARTRLHIRFGQPFHLHQTKRATKEEIAAATSEIMRHIAELLPEQYRGGYQGQSQAETA